MPPPVPTPAWRSPAAWATLLLTFAVALAAASAFVLFMGLLLSLGCARTSRMACASARSSAGIGGGLRIQRARRRIFR